MQTNYQGTVQKHLTKNWGDKTFYSFTLAGTDGFFGTGISKPPTVGASISFVAKTNAKGFLEVDPKTIEYRKDGTPSTAKVKGEATSTDYWSDRLARDIKNDEARELGASRNTALTIIDLMLKHEALPLPKTVAKREEFLWTVLDKYTAKLMGAGETSLPEPMKEAEPKTVEKEVTAEDGDWT